jgi:hypothetical protein
VFYDVQFAGTFVHVARGEQALRLAAEWTGDDADVLAIDARTPSRWFPLPLICTCAVARLIGLPSRVLRPDAFYRECLKYGATIVHESREARHGPITQTHRGPQQI